MRRWSDSPTQTEEPSEPEISVRALLRDEVMSIDDAHTPLVGEHFDKYQLVGELAVGGMAEIFLALHRGIEGFVKVVVIKRVLPQFASSPEFVQMFIEEARLAARLEHANIVRTYEFGERDGQYFTVMEYLPGEDIGKVLNKLNDSAQRMPFATAASIAAQVCSALHFAHELTDFSGRPLNLVHRDVNPANILITYGGEVKIIDFGIAKTNNRVQTRTDTIKGKLAYMAPEQVLARGIDRRTDVFSTGVVLWEMLTGRPLFLREHDGATLYSIMNDPIGLPSRFRPELPPRLESIVMRALARTPADRYETAEDMQRDLEDFLASERKQDARMLARMMDDLFGSTRADAKRGIAQTRSLRRNISLVMKLRTEVRSELAEHSGQRPPRSSSALPQPPPPARRRRWLWFVPVLGFAMGAVGIALGYQLVHRQNPVHATLAASPAQAARGVLKLDSTPPGAAIFLGGEPTGLRTPATIGELAPGPLLVRLELPGYLPIAENTVIRSGVDTTKRYTLDAATGRLVLHELPVGATILVDGTEYEAGEVISLPAGKHQVGVAFEGKTIAEQEIETGIGDQGWELQSNKFVRK